MSDFNKEREMLRDFAQRHGLRHDWHEPDEQDVTARVIGYKLDNAMGNELFAVDGEQLELLVVVEHEPTGDKIRVNLATLLAMATAA